MALFFYVCHDYKTTQCGIVMIADCASLYRFTVTGKDSCMTVIVVTTAGGEGLQGLSVTCLLTCYIVSPCSHTGMRCWDIRHRADDMMDYLCHCQYSQNQSAADKVHQLAFSAPRRPSFLLIKTETELPE